MNLILPNELYLVLAVSSFIIVLVFLFIEIYVKKYKSNNISYYNDALKILDRAHKESLKIISKAQEKSLQIISTSKKQGSDLNHDLSKILKTSYERYGETLDALNTKILSEYESQMKRQTEYDTSKFFSILDSIKEHILSDINTFSDLYMSEEKKVRDELKLKYADLFTKADQDVQKYIEDKKDEVRKEITDLVVKASTKYLLHSLEDEDKAKLINLLLEEEFSKLK